MRSVIDRLFLRAAAGELSYQEATERAQEYGDLLHDLEREDQVLYGRNEELPADVN